MRKGETLTATEKMERARQNTRASMARELLYGVIFSRLWPAWLHQTDNPEYPHILVVESLAGRMTWRVAVDEFTLVEHLDQREPTSQRAADRMPILLHLASEGWR